VAPTTIVPDTNLFYGKGADLASLASHANVKIAPSIISALEILCAEADQELGRRQQAATNWLKYAENAVVDNEVAHAVRLGYQPPPAYVSDFVNAMERFGSLKDISTEAQQAVGLDLTAAVVAKQQASARFVLKVGAIFDAYRAQVNRAAEERGEKIPFVISHSDSLVRSILSSFRADVENSHLSRIEDVSKQLMLEGRNSRDTSAIQNYIDLYMEFLIKKTVEGGAHINDFIDLQFFAYLDLGYVFASKEKKWKELAERAGKQSMFIAISS